MLRYLKVQRMMFSAPCCPLSESQVQRKHLMHPLPPRLAPPPLSKLQRPVICLKVQVTQLQWLNAGLKVSRYHIIIVQSFA